MKRIAVFCLIVSMLLCFFAACSPEEAVSETLTGLSKEPMPSTASSEQASADPSQEVSPSDPLSRPKYVFLFIGDGMSYPQLQVTADYLGALEQSDPPHPSYLNFMNFSYTGSAVNYDSSSFIPDSASSATAIASGHKTYSGSLNVDETGTIQYETIAEKVHAQLGMKVGIVTSVNLNHATPSAFYAHQASRSSYYDIALELMDSGFEYFAGGMFLGNSSKEGKDLYELAEQAGYTLCYTQADAQNLNPNEKNILIAEHIADKKSMPYELDRGEAVWALADYVEKGIALLDNENGFFLMCEGGKIDWACHANDAASAIGDVIALSDAVQVAIDFASEHPDETLILVTGDHETGGMTIGYANTGYSTFLPLLQNQRISFARYNSDYVSYYQDNGTDFDTVLADIEQLFGLKVSGEDSRLVLTEYELELLREAYNISVHDRPGDESKERKEELYGGYEPLTVTITHILNRKAGLSFTTYSHTGLPVAVFAEGVGAERFGAYYDSTQIFVRLSALLGVE